MKLLKTKVIETIRKLMMLRASPHQIAMGFAVGAFIGVFPTFGFGALVIFAIASIWKFNVPAAIIGTLSGNPILSPVWIAISCLVTGISPKDIKVPNEKINEILAHYSQIGLKYLIGNFAISALVAIISYFVIIAVIRHVKKNKKEPR